MKVNSKLAQRDHSIAQQKAMVGDYKQFFTKKQGAFKGIKKTFVPKDGFLDDPNYIADVKVVTTVKEKLDWFNRQTKLFLKNVLDIEATNSDGAQTIELKVDGVSFGNLTAIELMRLKGILTDKSLDDVYTNIPVREDNKVWNPSTDGEYEGREVFEDPMVSGQTRTSENEEIILKDPNVDPEHLPNNYRAQTTVKRHTVITGDYTIQNFTGEWTHQKRAELLRRKSAILEAVNLALTEINSIECKSTNLDVDGLVEFLTFGKSGNMPTSPKKTEE
jgi:hypothetical protein